MCPEGLLGPLPGSPPHLTKLRPEKGGAARESATPGGHEAQPSGPWGASPPAPAPSAGRTA